jgi:hypothetical protein
MAQSKNGPDVLSSSTPPQPAPSLLITTLPGGKILVNGHTLAMNTTLTLEVSGSVVTRVALGTDQAGQTFLLGDSITKAPGTSCVGRCSEIRASIQSTSANMHPTAMDGVSSGSTSAASLAAHIIGPSEIAHIVATACLGLFMLYFAG